MYVLVFGSEKSGTLKQSTIKATLRESRVKQDASKFTLNAYNSNEYSDYHIEKRNKNSLSANKVKRDNFATAPHSTDHSFSYVKKAIKKLPPNDFDPKTVKEGLDLIDLEIHDLDQNIPEEEYEKDDELEELIRANKLLRDKVSQISDLVVSAITKA